MGETMTPEQKIKCHILIDAIENGDAEWCGDITAENVDEIYKSQLMEKDAHWDYENEFREGAEETDIPCEWSRHYESESVARKLHCGTWVGWTYWHGGGKHGEPESIPWMEHAYELDVTEEQRMVTVRTFAKHCETGAT